ncbi:MULTISPECIES: hypothetical protein [unclassified Bradyrhizobium]
MRITSKVHASWMPAAAPFKIKGIAKPAGAEPGFIWAIHGANCMQFGRSIAFAV